MLLNLISDSNLFYDVRIVSVGGDILAKQSKPILKYAQGFC